MALTLGDISKVKVIEMHGLELCVGCVSNTASLDPDNIKHNC